MSNLVDEANASNVTHSLTVISSHDGCVLAFSALVALKPQHKKLSCTFFLMSSEARFQPSSANCCCWTGLTAKQDAAMENWIKNSKNRIIMYCAHKCNQSRKMYAGGLWTRIWILGKKDTKNSITWWCFIAPARPISEMVIRKRPQPAIPPTIGKWTRTDIDRPYRPITIRMMPIICNDSDSY